MFDGHTVLAPLTKGGNLPFRRLCVEHGATITMSEMAYARSIVRRAPPEMALLRKHDSETCFGAQLAVKTATDGIEAGKIAAERGAAFIDVNAGCPIHDVVKRGMGATLMQRPTEFAAIIEAMVAALDVPVTVKIRSGWDDDHINAAEVARLLEAAGASAITLHGRTKEQHYSKAADWTLVKQLVEERSIPIIGNGDIASWHEADDRREATGCAAVMVARGALMKPWLFREIRERRTWLPSAEERVDVYLRLIEHQREHFGADARGRKKAFFFLPWHFSFLNRWRPWPEAEYAERARDYPLMQTRAVEETDLPPLEAVLRDSRSDVQREIAAALWASTDRDDAIQRLLTLGTARTPDAGEAEAISVAQG